MSEKQRCFCGAMVDIEDNYCGKCGNPLKSKIVCPRCAKEVKVGNFCGACGRKMTEKEDGDYAALIPWEVLSGAGEAGFDVQHNTKALFFEDGKLVKQADSGRYTLEQDGLLDKLFKKKKRISAVVIDAGDVMLDFAFRELKSGDGLEVNAEIDVVLRLEDADSFFVNVMKNDLSVHESRLREILYDPVKQEMQSFVGDYTYAELSSGFETKERMATVMESHLRRTLASTGLALIEIRSLSFRQKESDEIQKIIVDGQLAVRKFEAETENLQKTGDAQVGRYTVETGIMKKTGDAQIDRYIVKAENSDKRNAVYKKIREAEIDRIKTDEEFRKFQMEVDRDRALDEAEWNAFRDEILYREEDRQRDRRFLVRKIELQQDLDLQRLEILKNKELKLDKLKGAFELLDLQQKRKMELEIRRVEHQIMMQEMQDKAARGRMIIEKETQIQSDIMELDLELKKAETQEAIFNVQMKMKQKKSELGLLNLEKIKEIKRKDEYERMLMHLEEELKKLDMMIRKMEAEARIEIDRMLAKSKVFREKAEAVKGLSNAELISLAGEKQAELLKDLAQTQEYKGMDPEQILAQKDPEAFGRALEERARNTDSEEMKALYRDMMSESKEAMKLVAQAHKESADRAERMNTEALRAMGGQSQKLADAERGAADRIESVSGRAMDNMSHAAAGTRAPEGGGAGTSGTVVKCSKCRNVIEEGKNFCSNCGTKMY